MRSYPASRADRGRARAANASRHHPPRYRATLSAASERTSIRPVPALRARLDPDHRVHPLELGVARRILRPNSPCSEAKRSVRRRSCRSTSWTLSAQNPQVPSYSSTAGSGGKRISS